MEPRPERKVIRLQNYDYSQNGAYFVTLDTYHRAKLFWSDSSGRLSPQGRMALEWVERLPAKFSGVMLDCYAVMPDHMHCILFLDRSAAALPAVMDWYKTMTTNAYIRGVKAGEYPPFDRHVWHRTYYEHVIRNETDLYEIRTYIQQNPLKWQLDGRPHGAAPTEKEQR